MKKKRHIPVISFNELELKSKEPQVYRSLIEGIDEAIQNKKDEYSKIYVRYSHCLLFTCDIICTS
mgnify:CR=1 FL=1